MVESSRETVLKASELSLIESVEVTPEMEQLEGRLTQQLLDAEEQKRRNYAYSVAQGEFTKANLSKTSGSKLASFHPKRIKPQG